MGYASLGIPMAMVMFQSMGERMNKAFSVIIQKLKKWIGCSRTEASEFDLILVRFEPWNQRLLGHRNKIIWLYQLVGGSTGPGCSLSRFHLSDNIFSKPKQPSFYPG